MFLEQLMHAWLLLTSQQQQQSEQQQQQQITFYYQQPERVNCNIANQNKEHPTVPHPGY